MSFDTSALSNKAFPNAPSGFLIRCILGLRRFLLKLADIVVPADAAVFERVIGIGYTAAIGSLTRLGIPDILEAQPHTAAELAAKTGTAEDAIHRSLRAAVTMGIFSLEKDGRFSNNRLSRTLRSGQLSRAKEFAEYFSSKANCLAYCEFDHILETGEDGFLHANGLDLWEWFDKHPQERETFAQMMMGVTIGESSMVAKLYPFNDIKKLCDVGGGRGTLLSELVIRYPHMKGVLFDSEGVIESADSLLKARGMTGKVELITGDFFKSIPSGCDAYLLKNVMHDWDDEHCKQILNNCRQVMRPSQKVLLVEILLEKYDQENFASLRDIHVMTVCSGGRERSRAEYASLLQQSGFKMRRIFHSPIISVIEGVAV